MTELLLHLSLAVILANCVNYQMDRFKSAPAVFATALMCGANVIAAICHIVVGTFQ